MDLELRHLTVVCTIADSGSVTKAAAELGVAQPALTAQLGRIERALGGALFTRDHRGARPTPLGDLVVERAQLLLPAMAGLLEDAQALTRSERRAPEHLSVGSSTSAVLAPLIQRLHARFSDLAVSTVASWSSDDLASMLADDRLDVAVIGTCSGGPPPSLPGLQWRTFSIDPVFVLLSADHPLADRSEVSLADLSGDAWAATPGDGCFRECFAAACSREGFTPASFHEVDAASCIELVGNGTAVALCQAIRVFPDLVTVPVVGAPLRWNHMVGWRPGSPVDDVIDDVVATVGDSHRELIERSEIYSQWLLGHPDLGVQSTAA